ncbi:hypothetical protein SPRG_16816 [Saprolegnia parasitica CBS 223.65]|uniref:PhoD-like phosphatase metallophosphatase domain-containing protein n=1 Tax=Saprolegnia parasitica (strain CBS 223.65) TaxID=695850 RepID=A0A067BT25_SAPPC|nr:hypothetical protein SPRG_16816 [Saprolegnia parasitica CBS 223.65]KDO17782.1 hypothetical protein SPRG_16816 [Saprolegnia parasitica CBS 223.65]|eukprot:XP_012211508.1 hypothetical protein SPRG_16816 [Saprolegnia parasitica CBS 223.65]
MQASTLPADVSAPFSFAFGSCTMAVPFLYDLVGFGGNLEYIASVLSPAFMLLLGDQVYADVDMYPRDTDALYEATVQDRSYQALTQSTPIFSMYDDHEIYNNWNQGEDDDPLYTERVGLFHRYFGQRNPRPLRDGDHYYAWQAGAASFFMLDVRKYASPKAMVDGPQKTKLGAVQKSHLLSWLLAAETPFKFIVSPMVVSSLGLHSTDEGWALYRAEYHEIFDVVVTHNISGVVVLSGDLHWAGFFQHGAYPFLFEVRPTMNVAYMDCALY